MTISSSVSSSTLNGNGAATYFPFSFTVWDASQLRVYVTAPGGSAVESTNWTATLTGTGGTVKYPAVGGTVLPAGATITILRNMPFTQEIDLVQGVAFDPVVIEVALDQLTATAQQLREEATRSVKVPPGSTTDPSALIAQLQTDAENAATSAASAVASANEAAASAAAAQAASGGVKVSGNDTMYGDLEAKLLAGTGVLLSTQNDGASETRTVSVDVGTSAGKIPVLDGGGKLATAIIPSGISSVDPTARDIAMMTSMIVWRNSSRASGPIPSGFLNTFQTDELATKTNATYDAMNKLYVNQTQATAGPSALSGTASYSAAATVIDRSFSIPNSSTVTYVGVHSSVVFSGKIKIALYVSAGVYNIVVSQSISHTGSGLEWFALTVPYVVPSSGVYNVGVYYNFTGTNVQTVNVSRATVTSDATGDGVSLTESSGSVLPVGVKYTGAALNMILVPAAITIATPKSVALNIEHIPLVTVTLNTDLIAEASIDGGTTWATGQLVKLCDMDATAGSQLLSATIDVSAQTGSSVKWRITTANTKAQSVRCVGIIKAA